MQRAKLWPGSHRPPPPSEASSIDVDRTKMTVRSDPIVGGASVKVAERGLHTEPCFLVTLSRSDLSAHTLVSDVCALALHLYLKKEDPIKISVKF